MTFTFVLLAIEHHFLVYWPEEDCYSEVPQSKVVGEPSETIQVKERGKIYIGKLVDTGNKRDPAKVELHSRRDFSICRDTI